MPESLAQIWLHIVFSTKDRKPWLTDIQIRRKVHAYLTGICRQMKSPALIVGGVEDHVHILCSQSKNVALKDLIQNVKQGSSKWIKSQWSDLNGFYWQKGYAAFSVSPPYKDKVQHYIANQEMHHNHVGYQEEFRWFLDRHQVPYQEQYVWD